MDFYIVHVTQKRSGKHNVQFLNIVSHKKADDDLVERVIPYLNIKETMFLKFDDMMQLQNTINTFVNHLEEGGATADEAVGQTIIQVDEEKKPTPSSAPSPKSVPHPVERTPEQASEDETSQMKTLISKEIPQASAMQQRSAHQSYRQKGCLVPFFLTSERQSYIYVDDIGEGYLVGEDKAREEINLWGNQLGWMFMSASLLPVNLPRRDEGAGMFSFVPGSVILEPCSWMSVEVQNTYIEKGDSAWILGIHLSRWTYLMMHVQVVGSDEKDRYQFAAIIWYHVCILQLSLLGEQTKVTPDDIKNDLSYFLQHSPLANSLTNIRGSITLFDGTQKRVSALMFGGVTARILGEDIPSIPQNPVYRFSGGKIFDFQTLKGYFNDKRPFIVASGRVDWSFGREFIQHVRRSGVHSSRSPDYAQSASTSQKLSHSVTDAKETPSFMTCMAYKEIKHSPSGKRTQSDGSPKPSAPLISRAS